MTAPPGAAVDAPVPAPSTAPTGPAPYVGPPPDSAGGGPGAAGSKERPGSSLLLAGASLCILATLLLGFLAELSFVGALHHNRDQTTAYADYRFALADATAPTGAVDTDGQLLALGTPMSILDIPAIGVHQTVLEGTTSTVLVSGPGHLRGSGFPGQDGTSILMGRRAAFGGPFRDIGSLAPGAVIRVTTGQGIAVYRVERVRHTGDAQPAPPTAGQGRLTLVTAAGLPYVPNGDALWVDAIRTSAAAPTSSARPGAGQIAAAEKAMASDPSAWVRLVFWAQGLLVAALLLTWAWLRWGRWQAWVVGVPVLLLFGTAVAGQAALLLPNLM